MKDIFPRSGYDLAAKILESHSNDAIETMLKYSNGAECDWLEFKAGMTLLPEAVKKHETLDDLYWDYLLSIIAMANTRGGAFIIGVKDRTYEAVSLSSCDPRHVIEKEGKEAYLRKEVLDRFDRPERKWTTKDRVVWSLPTSIIPFLDKRIMPYRGTDVIVLLVSPRKIGEELFVISKSSLGEFEHLPIRDMGEVGHVKRLTKDREFASHRAYRGEQLLTSQLGTWWAELDAEQQASKADEILDNAIRAYHVKLEEETRKKLRAFIPLDVEGDEPDEEDVEEFENPQAISVFDEDDDAWLNSNNKDGGTSDKGSTGSEVEDEAGGLDDDDEFEDDEREMSKRTIKIGLYELLEQQNRVVLVGEPGAGKTTCLAHFAVQQGKMERPRPHLFAFIALGRWVDGGSVRGLVEKTCGISQAQIDILLAEKRLHLILDALNECPDRLRPGAIENIRILLRDHPDLPVVLSSRKAEGAKLSGIPVFEVQSMCTDRQRLFLDRYLHDADAAQKILDSLLKQPGGASIAQNPMLLRMVVDVVRVNGDLPTGRASLYRRWLENWYAREEKKAKKAKDVLPWSKEESIRLLSQMAFAGRAEGYRDIPLDMARHSLGDKDGTFLDRLCQGPLLEIEEDFVHFRHETIQEYLCAEWLLAEPAALNSLPEKDYDTWGMPIAYAAELRLPNKLPEEMSDAVWEMNPWVAALVAASPLKKIFIETQPPDYVLANVIFCHGNLLDDQFQSAFRKEFENGLLFRQRNAPLIYLVMVDESNKMRWLEFECAYALCLPNSQSRYDWIFGKNFLHVANHLIGKHKLVGQLFKKKIREKTSNMILISGDSFFPNSLKCLPKFYLSDVIRCWCYSFSGAWTSKSRLRRLADIFGVNIESSCLPIESMPPLLGKLTKRRVKALSSLFGDDFVQKVLDAIPRNLSLWETPDVFSFLNSAKKNGCVVNMAARSIFVQVIKELEEIDVSPNGQALQNVEMLYRLLDESDIRDVLSKLSPLGKAMLKRIGSNFCELADFEGLSDAQESVFNMADLNDDVKRRNIINVLLRKEFRMSVFKVNSGMRYFFLRNPNFPEGVVAYVKTNLLLKCCGIIGIGSLWRVHVSVQKRAKIKYGNKYLFVADKIEPCDSLTIPNNSTVEGGAPKDASSISSLKTVGRCVNNNSDLSSMKEGVFDRAVTPVVGLCRRSDLIDPVGRRRIESELLNVRWDMTISFISDDRRYLFFCHPSFQDGVYCPTRSTQYQDMFEVGQVWNVRVCVKQNKKEGTFGFVARSVKPSKANPTCLPGSGNEKPVITRQQEDLPLAPAATSESHISIYIDETWPGTQDHAYEKIGVIGGIVVPWEGVDEKRLPVIKTHLDNGSAARNAIQTMLRQSTVFPFVFPIKWDHAVGAGGRRYFELVQHALMLLLGWMLPQRDQPTTVDVFLEHISGYMDGHDETGFINSLTQAMRLLSGGRRFANWQIRRVEWVDKEFGYVPYGDLVCKTCVPREEQQLLAREVKVREWDGFLPFSKDVFPLLRDMDTASPSGLADLLISFAKVAEDTLFFRRVRKLAIDRAKADEAVCTALISRFEECYARPDRDMALLNRVVPHFLNEFPPDLFMDRPRLQLLRILIGFQYANHNGDPDLATALVDQYHSLRPRILELDRDLCAYADLNLAVHHHDSFDFDKALSLVDGWINDPLFPALSVMNRGRMYSSRGQSLALLGRNQEADGAFARALSIFSAEPELLASDIAQTKTYQAMNALDHDAPSAVPLVEGLLGKSLIATALNLTALLKRPFAAHLFLKTLWRTREGRSVIQDALIKNLPLDIVFRKQHPYELILFYLALLTKEANPSYAKACVREMEQFFEAIEFGGTLGLIHAYMRVILKRYGLSVATDKDFFEELDIVEQYLTKAGTIINEFRMRWGNPSMSIDGILPFNYC